MFVLTWDVIRSGALFASLSVLAAGCYASNKGQAKEGQSHWLERCSSQADCSADQVCACGVCTIACEASTACGAGSTCEQVADRAACVDAPSSVQSVCLQTCGSDAPCETPGLSCREDACVARDIAVIAPSDAGNGSTGELDSLESLPARITSTPAPSALDEEPMSEEPSASKLRIALLWFPQFMEYGPPRFEPSGLCPEGSNVDYGGQVAQPIDVEVSLPMQLDISALEPPPPDALVALESGHAGGWSSGHLVLYRDGNGNGLLDPRNLEQGSPDEVLGTSGDWGLHFGLTPNTTSYVIYYSDERLPEYGPTIEAGYNVFRDETGNPTGSIPRVAVPLDTLIPVPVLDSPKTQAMNCEELCFAQDDEVVCPPTMAELPEGGRLDCHPGSALWSRTRCDGCFCFTAACSFNESCPAD